MSTVGNIVANLRLNVAQFMSGINQATAALRNFGNNMNWNGFNGGMNTASRNAKSLAGDFKDLDRIVSGILISQAFYQGVNAIEDAISATTRFKNEMENAQTSMEYFLGTPERAKAMITNMKDFAAVTAFSTEQALVLSRRLMNAGFQPENVRPVMEILNDASAIAGGTAEQMDRIVLAMTQIKTAGVLKGQEIRQLAEAQIPVYRILQEQLGLTAEQMSNIGDLKIPADTAIAAILKGLQRYDGAAEKLANNVRGLWDTIKDDTLMVADKLFDAPYQSFKGFLTQWRDTWEEARAIVESSGVGGLFEHFVPPELHDAIRRIIWGFQRMGEAIKITVDTLKPMFEAFAGSAIMILSQVVPALGWLHLQISRIVSAIVEANPWIRVLGATIIGLVVAQVAARALMFLWSVTRVGVICASVATAVSWLTTAIRGLFIVLARNPVAALIMLIAAALLYLLSSIKAVSDWLDNLVAKLGALTGADLSGILDPEYNASIEDQIESMNKDLEDMMKDLTGVGKTAEKSGKKVKDKFVASFDELYQIPDQLGKLEDGLEMPKLDPINFDPLKGFDPSKLKVPGKVWETPDWLDDIFHYGIPARVQPEPPPPQGPNAGGAAGSVGMPAQEADDAADATNRLTEAMNAAKIAASGLGIGFLELSASIGEWTLTTSARIGGWVLETSASIGNWVLTTSAALGGWVTARAREFATWATETSASVGTWVLETSGSIGNWILETSAGIGNWVLETSASIGNWILETGTSFGTWVSDRIDNIGKWARTTGKDILDWISDHGIAFGRWFDDTGSGMGKWTKDRIDNVVQFSRDTGKEIRDWAKDAAFDIGNWITETSNSVGTWVTDRINNINNWATTTGKTIGTWVTEQTTSIGKWVTNTGTNIGTWVTTAITNVGKFARETSTSIGKWVSGTSQAVYDWGMNTGSNIATWSNGVVSSVASAINNTWGDINKWLQGTSDGVSKWVNNVAGNFAAFANNASSAVGTWASSTWVAFNNWLTGTSSGVYNWAKNTLDNIVNWAKSAWATIKSLASSVGETLGVWSESARETLSNTGAAIGQWYDSNKQWVVPVVVGAVVVGGAIAIAATGGAAAPAMLPAMGAMAALGGLETGGIVNKEQIIRVGERNRVEAVIPMQNSTYMRPFSEAVASDLYDMLAGDREDDYGSGGGSDTRPIVYVHNLIASQQGLKELYRELRIIQIEEDQREGR